MALRTAALIRRLALVAALLLLTALAPIGTRSLAASHVPASTASAPNTWAPTGSMTVARDYHTATLLHNGKVLVVGGCAIYQYSGCYKALSSAELYDPSTGTFTLTNSMSVSRQGHTATLLANGQVLVAGGTASGGGKLASAELYDPSTNSWLPAGTMAAHRVYATATLLANGQVLVVGGYGSGNLASAELYNPTAGTWSLTGSMSHTRYLHTATLLANGQVLVAGGADKANHVLSNAELYNPATGTWLATGSLDAPRESATATLLANGQVLVAGGNTCCNAASQPFPTASAELYDPRTGTWTATGSMNTVRIGHTATLLNNKQVLVAGGYDTGTCCTSLSSAEVYDPSTGTWTFTGSLPYPQSGHTATMLSTGQVLVAGGSSNYGETPIANAALYTPGAGPLLQLSSSQISFVGQLVGTTSPAQTVTLTNTGSAPLLVGSVAISGSNTTVFSTTTTCTTAPVAPAGTCRIVLHYTPAVTGTATASITITDNAPTSPQGVSLSGSGRGPNAWSGTGAMVANREFPTATLLTSGQVLAAGGFDCSQGPCSTLASAELYDPLRGTWNATGSMMSPREYHTATLLSNGHVLVAGGVDNNGNALASAELYDPHTGTWAATGPMRSDRQNHTATLLSNGEVLVAGGSNAQVGGLASTELYDPHTGTWVATGSMHSARQNYTATLLPNGKVLVAGGDCCGTAELYNPRTGTWTPTGSMISARNHHTATLLPNGKVLVAGGCADGRCATPLATAELYNPRTGTWMPTGTMTTVRWDQTATLLSNGQVLVASGGTAERYDTSTGTWSSTATLLGNANSQTATLLPSGNVLDTGSCCSNTGYLIVGAQLYTPALLTENPTSGSYGQTLVLTGTNFYAHETINIYPDSTGNPVLYSATANGSGSFVLTDTVRQGTYGVHTLIAVGQSSGGTISVPFTVLPTLVLTPTSGAAGSTVMATGYGFGATEKVALHWNSPTGPLLGTATSNAYGTFANGAALSFTVPTGATAGTYQVYAIGQSSGAQASATFTVP